MANGIFGFALYSVLCSLFSVICYLYSVLCYLYSVICTLVFPLPRHRLRRCHSLSGEGEFSCKCLVGWNAKLYNCPSSKRDEQRRALRRELTNTHSTRFCYFYFFLSTFCFSTCFHSLVIDCVAATPSPAMENFRANVWWVESKTI